MRFILKKIDIFEGRVFSFLGNPGYLGQFMLLELIFGVYLIMNAKKRKWRILYFLITLLMLFVLLISGTRAAMLGIMVVSFLLCLKYRREIWKWIKKYKLVFVIGVILMVLSGVRVLPKERFSFSGLSLRSVYSRFEIWNGTRELIKERLILGYGSQSFYVYFPEVITKKFMTLEENINLNADRIHNESLEVFFYHGLLGIVLYFVLAGLLVWNFFRAESQLSVFLSLAIMANMVQNQFSFSDISIRMVLAFCLAGVIFYQAKNKRVSFSINAWQRYLLSLLITVMGILLLFMTVYKPFMSQKYYALAKNSHDNYAMAVNAHKTALYYMPYYSELWYELMFLDPSSMGRALDNLSLIEGDSGNVLAWKGNYYADTSVPLKI